MNLLTNIRKVSQAEAEKQVYKQAEMGRMKKGDQQECWNVHVRNGKWNSAVYLFVINQ